MQQTIIERMSLDQWWQNPDTRVTIVKFTQLCSKFPPTALLNFACDWLALNRDVSFGRLTIERVTLYPYREPTITSKVQECCGREFAAKLGEFDYSDTPSISIDTL